MSHNLVPNIPTRVYRVVVTRPPDDGRDLPSRRHYYAERAAQQQADRLAALGCTAHVEQSAPLVWPSEATT